MEEFCVRGGENHFLRSPLNGAETFSGVARGAGQGPVSRPQGRACSGASQFAQLCTHSQL